MVKKPSYVDLLKEQIALREYDIKDFGYKGPMTEPIISYDGEGEMETNQTITDLLDKYYLKEKKDERIIEQGEGGEAGEEPEQNEIVTGEEPDDIDATMDDFEDEILEGEDEDEAFDPDDVNEALESAIIERLIKEMEEEVGPDKEIEPEKDEETKQAGTDFATEKDIDKVLEEIELELALAEQDEEKAEGGEEEKVEGGEEKKEEGGEEEKLDVDKEVKTEHHRGLGPISYQKVENLEESFRIFLEQLEDEIEKSDKEEEKGEEKKEDEKEEEKKEEVTEDFDFVFEDDETEASEEKKEDEKEEEKKDEESIEECKLKEALRFIFEEGEPSEEEGEEKKEDEKEEKKEEKEGELTSEMIDLMLEELDLTDDDIDKW